MKLHLNYVKKVGFLEYYKELDTEEGMEQYENVNELLNSIKMFVDDPNNVDKSLIAYLQNLPLESEKIEEERELKELEETDMIKKKSIFNDSSFFKRFRI